MMIFSSDIPQKDKAHERAGFVPAVDPNAVILWRKIDRAGVVEHWFCDQSKKQKGGFDQEKHEIN